jgi:thymidylate synthase (FAD)
MKRDYIKIKTMPEILDKGFIELLDVFGNDLTIVNAARVSFNKESTELNSKDEKLIQYLAKHNHITPFFHPQLRFRIKMPIYVAREWYRHTIGFARNEVSRRYVDTPPECYNPQDIRARDTNLKQGSKLTNVENNMEIALKIKDIQDKVLTTYEELLSLNVAPEVARGILPQSMYTEFIETASLAAYARLCKLRLDPNAQKEIQEYAKVLSELIEEKFPMSWKALTM